MDLTYVDEKSLKSLEDLSIFLTTGMISLMTLLNTQIRAIEIGIMKEDMNERANTIIWDIKRLLQMYNLQLESVVELLPPEFNPDNTIEKLKQVQLRKARAMTRKVTKNG